MGSRRRQTRQVYILLVPILYQKIIQKNKRKKERRRREKGQSMEEEQGIVESGPEAGKASDRIYYSHLTLLILLFF